MRIIILLVLFIILTMVLGGFIVYDKVINKNSKAQDNENNKVEINDENTNEDFNNENTENQNTIDFVGEKTTDVSYNPDGTSYNLNFKINENGVLVFTDLNNTQYNITYSSIIGKCKYVTLAKPYGKQMASFEVAVITENGEVYYKKINAFDNSTLNDNFIKVTTDIKLNGIGVKKESNNRGIEEIIVYDDNNKMYYLVIEDAQVKLGNIVPE